MRYNDTVLAVQFVGGLGVEIAPTVALTLDYRLFLTDDLRVGSGVGFGKIEYTNSMFTVGLRKSF